MPSVIFRQNQDDIELGAFRLASITKISVTSPIVINVPTRELLAGETKSSFVSCFQHLNNKNNVCKQISSL